MSVTTTFYYMHDNLQGLNTLRVIRDKLNTLRSNMTNPSRSNYFKVKHDKTLQDLNISRSNMTKPFKVLIL